MVDYHKLLQVAIEEAKIGLKEGGVPVGACLADQEGKILGRGHNRRVQQGDPTVHGETDAFSKPELSYTEFLNTQQHIIVPKTA